MIPVVRTVSALRDQVRVWQQQGAVIGLVPTMGALHAGHMALVKAAQEKSCDRIVLSLFVNPKQFDQTQDLAAYPRQEANDVALAAQHGAHVVFAPNVAEMYPPGFCTTVHVAGLTDVLCGATRDGHFSGVATVVIKLLNQVQADQAFFGEKDYQQLTVIRRLAMDLDNPTQIVGVPTVREPDGLALSSRNSYLTRDERQIAPVLHAVLQAVSSAYTRGEGVTDAIQQGRKQLLSAGFSHVDYLEVRAADDLSLVMARQSQKAVRVFVAAHLGTARLIDNLALEGGL